MATIYDMASGKIISGNTTAEETVSPGHIPSPGPSLQTVEDATPIEDLSPVDAYMVMLQELLKKL